MIRREFLKLVALTPLAGLLQVNTSAEKEFDCYIVSTEKHEIGRCAPDEIENLMRRVERDYGNLSHVSVTQGAYEACKAINLGCPLYLHGQPYRGSDYIVICPKGTWDDTRMSDMT
jgi:hypothetical protein